MDLTKNNMKRLAMLIAFSVALVLIAMRIDVVAVGFTKVIGILEPFFIGGVIAFIINVPMSAIERKLFPLNKTEGKPRLKGIGRFVSIILSTIFILLLLAILALWVVPELGKSLIVFANSLQYVIPDFISWLNGITSSNETLNEFVGDLSINFSEITTNFITYLKDSAGEILSSGVTIVTTIASAVFSTVIGLVFACYILAQKGNLKRQAKKVLNAIFNKNHYKKVEKVSIMTYDAFHKFLSGQCIEGLITGTLFFIVLSIFSFPYAAVIAVVIGFSTLIPIFGAIIGTIIGAVFILTVSPIRVISYLIISLILQQIEGNVIYPHVVGTSLGLPSIWVLVAVTTGGSLFGVTGMILFIPIVSVMYQLFKEWVNIRIDKKGGVLPEQL
ncbi:MAG: AI-2E family transporter [Peptostreptococcaceae bacterium]|nr:AI-2E family transporter [Peptostreptococcaceae bacterium]